MSKTASRIAIGAVALVVVLAVVVGVVLGQLGRLIKYGVETVGPTVTGTTVTLGRASVSMFSGEGALRQLEIGNPPGYSDLKAFDVGRVAVAVDLKSVTAKVIHVRSVTIDAPKLLAEFDAAGKTNLKTIQEHVNALAQKEPRGTAAPGKPVGGGEKKLIIDDFRFTNAEVRVLAPSFKLDNTIKLHDIELKNLGGKGGASASDIASQILRPILDAATSNAVSEYVRAKSGELQQKAKENFLNKVFK